MKHSTLLFIFAFLWFLLGLAGASIIGYSFAVIFTIAGLAKLLEKRLK